MDQQVHSLSLIWKGVWILICKAMDWWMHSLGFEWIDLLMRSCETMDQQVNSLGLAVGASLKKEV